jgi:hypothetical protein
MPENMSGNYYTIAAIHPEEESEFIDFLRSLISYGDFSSNATTLGITKQVISKGLKSLTEKQSSAFETLVLKPYTRKLCPNCSCRIPWSEMFETVVEGGECRECKRIFDHMG